MNHFPKDARTTRLVEGRGVAVDRCRCGTFHVHIGQVSVRLPEAGVEALQQALADALIEVAVRKGRAELRL